MDKKWTGYTVFMVIDSKNVLQAVASWQNPQTMSRKDKKALEKELPWSAIPLEHRELYRQALVKEWTTWKKYEAVKILSLEYSREVEKLFDPSRILAARVCYRDKRAGDQAEGPDSMSRRHRPRLAGVTPGCSDINPPWVDADPAAGSFAPRLVHRDRRCDWRFSSRRPSTIAQRQEPLFIRQPKEGLPDLQPGQLLLVVRRIFGLANSPRLFWRFLRDSLYNPTGLCAVDAG